MKATLHKTVRNAMGILLIAGALSSCKKDKSITPGDIDDPEVPVALCDTLEVSGSIKEPTVWKEGFVYVINGFDLRVESVLTIEPGVIVKIKDARITVVGGKIIAKGTADKRIVFTSLADDRYCGDTNGDGPATKPAKGDWVEISLNGTTGTVFQYVDIFYAGQNSGGNNRAVDISGPNSVSFTFDHCRIAHTLYLPGSSSYAFYGSTSMKDASVSVFTNNALYDNGRPIYFNAFYTLNESNVFHNPEKPSEKNTHNGIYLYGHVLDATVTWGHTEVPYVVAQSYQVYNAATINIEAGVIVKFMRTGDYLSRSAPQNILVDPAAILTSYKDDEHGGDTNGDGNNSSPAKGDWEGLYNNYGGSPYWEQSPNILYAEN